MMKALSSVALLGELIRIPSVNPEGEPGVDEPGEARLAGYLEKLLNDLGAEVWLREVLPGRPNVVARFPSDRAGKPRLLLAPHTDTVSVAGMTIDPFGGDVSEGKVWGRGASDTKGPMASMLCALSRLGEEIPKLGYEIWFAGLMGEESGQHGAKALASEENFDFVIAGEATDLKTVHAHKGSLWVTMTAHGKAVHASAPEKGENAIYKMTSAIERIRERVIPEGVEITHQSSAPLFTDPEHPLLLKLSAQGATPVGAPWFCDAAIFAAKGMPAVALGPGSMAQAHTADEFISVKDLEEGADFFEQFLRSL